MCKRWRPAIARSKVIGSSVVNDANETIGKIDDILVSSDGKQPYAVLSIGGFLGMGTHLVVVPYDTLKFADNKVTLPGGTKEGPRLSISTAKNTRPTGRHRPAIPALPAARCYDMPITTSSSTTVSDITSGIGLLENRYRDRQLQEAGMRDRNKWAHL